MRSMNRFKYKHNMYLWLILENQINHQWIQITNLLQTIKCFTIHTADVSIEEKLESLIILFIKSSVEAKTQIRPKKLS